MKKQQSGFTLIELVVVIVILGILAATAVPRFVGLTANAEQAVCDGVVGALISSAVIQLSANTGTPVSRATIIANTPLSGNPLPVPVAGAAGIIDVTVGTSGVCATTDLMTAGLSSD